MCTDRPGIPRFSGKYHLNCIYGKFLICHVQNSADYWTYAALFFCIWKIQELYIQFLPVFGGKLLFPGFPADRSVFLVNLLVGSVVSDMGKGDLAAWKQQVKEKQKPAAMVLPMRRHT